MTRLLRPFLWVTGSLLLVAALVGPFLQESMLYANHRKTAEQLVDHIVYLEEQYFQERGVFLTFTKNEMPEVFRNILTDKGLTTSPFSFDAFLQGDEFLVIRAMTRQEALKSGTLPLMVFTYKKQLRLNKVVREWLSSPQ